MGIYDTSAITTTDLDSLSGTELGSVSPDTIKYVCDWSDYFGSYLKAPMLKASVDRVAIWAVGAGKIKAKEKSHQILLDKITGFGKDSFRDILINLIKVALNGGDSHGEIIKDKAKRLINLVPRNPANIEHEANENGILIKYNQININPTTKKKEIIGSWEPEEIFHLCWGRMADEIHGRGVAEILKDIITKDEQARIALAKFIIRLNLPIRIIEVDSDDTAKLTSVKNQYKEAIDKGEVIVVPKDSIKVEDHKTENQVQDVLNWNFYLMKYFVISMGCPEVILGSINSKDTEGASKILYLAFEQVIKNVQIWVEEQVRLQLGIEIDLPEPPSVDPMVLLDSRKAGATAGTTEQGNKNMKVEGQNK